MFFDDFLVIKQLSVFFQIVKKCFASQKSDYLKKDAELFYYKKIIEEHHLPISRKTFEHDFLSLSSEECLGKYPALLPYKWSWSWLETPLTYQDESFAEASRG